MGLSFFLSKSIKGESDIGYGGFFYLRKELLEKSGIDMEYVSHCENSERSELERTIYWFMLAEDDGDFILNESCHILYDEFKKYDISDTNLKRYNILMNALKSAIDDDANLEWS